MPALSKGQRVEWPDRDSLSPSPAPATPYMTLFDRTKLKGLGGLYLSVGSNNRRPGNRENNPGDKAPDNPKNNAVPGSKDRKKAGKIRR